MVMLLKTIILYIVLTVLFYRTGLVINKLIKKKDIIHIILYGFVFVTSILQTIYIPFILLHVSFKIVLYTTIAIMIVLVTMSFYICPISQEKNIINKNINKLRKIQKKNAIITGILLICVLIQATASSMLFNENADDSFYVSLMEQNIDSSSIYTIDPSLGTENTTNLSNYMISGHEMAMSVLSKIFSIPVTILCHTIWIFIMIIFSYIAYYILMRKFLKNKNAKIAIILLSVLFLFSGFTTRLRGIILLSRMWQGKEIFLNIILTLILSNLVNFNKLNKKQNTIKLLMLNFSAVFFTNTAIFLVTFAYLGFVVFELIKKQWKNIICFIITGIPIMIYGIIYLLVANNMQAQGIVDIKNIFKDYIGNGYYYLLYAISLVIIAIKGSKTAKKYFIFIPLIYALTIYNPLLTNIVAKYFTGANVFWRLLWLIPMEISIVYAFVALIYSNNNEKYQTMVIVIEIILLILLGKFAFTKDNGFKKAENLNKIPSEIIEQTQYILDEEKEERQITVMALPEPLHNATIRQLTSKINLFWSRDLYMPQLHSPEELEEMEKIYSVCIGNVPDIDASEFNHIREKYGVNWIIIRNVSEELNKYLKETKYKKVTNIKGDYLYQY